MGTASSMEGNDVVNNVPPPHNVASTPSSPCSDVNGIIDATLVDYDDSDSIDLDDYDGASNDEDDGHVVVTGRTEAEMNDDARGAKNAMKSWALIVNPAGVSTIPLFNYSIGTKGTMMIQTTNTTSSTTRGGGGGIVNAGKGGSSVAEPKAMCSQFDEASYMWEDGEARTVGGAIVPSTTMITIMTTMPPRHRADEAERNQVAMANDTVDIMGSLLGTENENETAGGTIDQGVA
jgi:hypothetical protein